MCLQPGENSAEERRIALDGGAYTLEDWLDYYGDDLGHQYWVEARVAGAPQPGGPGPDAPPVGQDAPPVLPLAIQQPTRTVGALQPGVNPWQGCVFLTETLRQNQETLRRECPQLRFATGPREAIDIAYWLGDYLPLPIQAFVNSDIVRKLVGVDVEAIVAERIPRIPDNNRPPVCRVDFFVYCRNGDVIRRHPGRTLRTTMHPHTMPFGSVLFSLAQAKEIGVGASLHLRPPGRAPDALFPQPGLALCTLSNVDESCPYDLQAVTWRRIREDCLQPTTHRVDISDGHLFPWWLMLGGTGRNRRLLDRGVTRVVASGRTLEVTLLDGEVVLYK